MRYSVNIPNLGDFADPRIVGKTARLAEEAGWDGLFIWDHLVGYNKDLVADFAATNLLLTAAALATDRIALGTQVTPVPRRRVGQLAREIATLDRLSAGRIIFGVGLGGPVENEYGRFGAPTDVKVLAGMLDEGLQAIMLLWSGEPITFHGRYVDLDDVLLRPAPIQQPRVPVWVGGEWPNRGPARRAARWDGSVINPGSPWDQPPDSSVIGEMHAFFQSSRRESGLESEPFDLVAGGSTAGFSPAKARDVVGPLADAGATWWDERFSFEKLDKFAAVSSRIQDGPPHLA